MQVTGGNADIPNSTGLLYRPNQTCSVVLVPLLFGSSNAETSGNVVTPHLICLDMTQILESYHSADMG